MVRHVACAMLIGLAACSSADPQPAPSPCEELAASCLVDQLGCEVDGGEARCVACAEGHYAEREAGACSPIPGEVLSHTFDVHTTPSGGEILGQCRSWTLENDAELWVNAVELTQNEASHHSNWTFVPEDQFVGPDGDWTCADRNYSQVTAAIAGGVIYAQSTQSGHEVQKFPDGVVVRIPPRARVISDIHTLNTTSDEVTGVMTISLYLIDEAAVTTRLAPFHLTYDELTIQPLATSRFTGECDLRPAYSGGPLDLKVHFVLPHTHALGRRMFIERFGGPDDGEPLIDLRGFNGEARGRAYDPPIDLADADGLRFGCEFDNPGDEVVGWGFGDQEMCEALGFAASPIGFESRVSEAVPGEMDGATHQYTGACGTLPISWAGK